MKNLKQLYFVVLLLFILPMDLACQDGGRDEWQKPDEIMDNIGIEKGMIIGEAGAGDGYFTFHLAERVGPDGHIYANDIDESALEDLEDGAATLDLENITTIHAGENDPEFPDDTLDMVVMMRAYHHFENPDLWMANVQKSLKPGAPLVIIDVATSRYEPWEGHFMSREEVVNEMSDTNFELVRVETFLPRDNIYVYRQKGAIRDE
jgi:ubiquinone/menaquinone biosynthesis C-methylase UbiE